MLILGPGQRGLTSVVAARAAGADTIIVTGLTRDAAKLALAKELGADHMIDVEQEDVARRVKELTNGHGADVVIEVSVVRDGAGRRRRSTTSRWAGASCSPASRASKPCRTS